MAIVIVAGVAVGVWLGYEVYLEHTKDARTEHDLGVEQRARDRANDDVDDVIEELEHTPAWNGPGNPTFGVGPDSTAP